MDAIVDVQNLTKVFRDFWRRPKVRAVNDVSFRIEPGQVFGLLGPNGSGKSTTIKMLLGLLYPSSGSILVLGKPSTHVAAKAGIGYLPEESHLYTQLSPRETLNFYGKLFGIGGDERRERVEQLLAMTGLTHAAGRPVGEFSKGMARRVGLAQALINDPSLVILDEPTSGLDPVGCRQVKDLILALAKRGKTVVLTSHLLADVEDVCDQLVILLNGRICAQGAVKELLVRQDALRLTVPALPREKLAELLVAVRKKVGSDPEVDHPSIELEQFFLKAIQQAGDSKGQAPGIAEYLMRQDDASAWEEAIGEGLL